MGDIYKQKNLEQSLKIADISLYSHSSISTVSISAIFDLPRFKILS